MMLSQKIWLILGYTLIVVGVTLHVHNVFIDAAKLKTANIALDKSHKGQNDIVKFNQDLRKVKADACFIVVVPADINKLLQQ